MKKLVVWFLLLLLTGWTAAGCTARPKIDSALERSLHDAVIQKNAGGRYLQGEFQTESHVILGTAAAGDRVTVYAWVLYLEYGYKDGKFQHISGGQVPDALTFEKDATGGYRLVEYWEAEDGEGNASSIRGKFPRDLWGDAVDSQKFIRQQEKECDENAAAYLAAQKKTAAESK